MPTFSAISKERLSACHPELQRLFNNVIKYYDCSILCGYRTRKEQQKVFDSHRSKVIWPFSKHNSSPSLAVDVMPYHKQKPHIRWEDTLEANVFAYGVFSIARELDIEIVWGGSWKKFKDLPHWELKFTGGLV